MDCRLTEAERNHLRRLIGWVTLEVGQTPDEMVATVQKIAPAIQDASEEGKARLVEAHQKASRVPKYVWVAIKALRKTLEPHLGDVVDAEWREDRQLKAPNGPHEGRAAGFSAERPLQRRVGGAEE